MSVQITWNGAQLARRMRVAEKDALNEIARRAVAYARTHHPGWVSRTGRSERALRAKRARLTREGASVKFGFPVAVQKSGRHVGGFFQETGFRHYAAGAKRIHRRGVAQGTLVRRPANSLAPALAAVADGLVGEIKRRLE